MAKAKVITLTDQQKTKFVVFDTHQQLLKCHFLLRLSHKVSRLLFRDWSANSQLLPRSAVSTLLIQVLFLLNELRCKRILPPIETGTRSTTFDEGDHLFTLLKTNHRIATARSILHEWNTPTTLSALTREWSSRHENRPTERNSFSLLLYNIISLQMHLEDLIEHISASCPNIWALTGLHFNDDVNYQLASYFKSRYTIYYQQGSNSFGGVRLAIAREVPHLIASEFNNINNIIAADVFNSNKKYTVGVVYSPPLEEVPINSLNRLHQYNRNLILIGDLNARHPSWHDVTSNTCGHRLTEWIDENQNLKIFNSAKPTSTRSRAVFDLIIAPSHVSSELAEIDQKMSVSDHYPVH